MSREPGGRPLRFFALLAIGWVAVRLASQPWAVDIAPGSPPALSVAGVAPLAVAAPFTNTISTLKPIPRFGPNVAKISLPTGQNDDGMILDLMHFIHVSNAFANRHYGSGIADDPPGEGIATGPVQPAPAPLLPPAPLQQASDRWRASAWILWRPDGSGNDLARLGRLGGSQAGIRIDREIAAPGSSRLAAYARATTALQPPAAPEAALGVALQPGRSLPVTVAVERRTALGDGGRNAMAAYVAGGFGPTPVFGSLQASGYAQAGVVGVRQRDAFVDGKFSLLATLPKSLLKLGGSLSGGAQPGVHRVDIGPEAQMRLSLPATTARLSLEWRERIAGRAAPSSGLALTLASDF